MILREVTPLSEEDCFMVFAREKCNFDFPIHVHSEYELNFIENAAGAQRIVGDSIEEIDHLELTLIANSNLEHGWFDHNCKSEKISEITIQFQPDLLSETLLNKNQFRSIRQLFEKAAYGVTFSKTTIIAVRDEIKKLITEKDGFYSVVGLYDILHILSQDEHMRELSSRSFHSSIGRQDSRRVEKILIYLSKNYQKDVSLNEAADLIGMTEVSLSRFLKQRTGRTFIDTLNDIRLGHACRMLIDTTHSIAEIALLSGFNNLSNFNRIFMKKRSSTPTVFRDKYKNSKFYL
ncbi:MULTISPECIES: AraC family transcriptional regulator [Sphingobacterium]|uniref:AraC family transcriptional regulator n=1 Tax=Sphingobacterium TaxID=28453 RepID=UPI0010536E19|nr:MULTISPECIES: AraC family transcriptional regulator [Sphingobacterium]MCW2262060.1 AraC-like DNA-binding protein [Sphingobacterium kitahiroshimense]TCR13193.1 AraC-like DNA-binding protein [Sphingobacterium sp. JUb78]